jgi:hypothetical protein
VLYKFLCLYKREGRVARCFVWIVFFRACNKPSNADLFNVCSVSSMCALSFSDERCVLYLEVDVITFY